MVNALCALENIQELEMLPCFPVNMSTNLGWMALMSGCYYEIGVIKINMTWTTGLSF